ncbi:hypothetical protein SAY86_014385 [Trapa natans]|uniref:Uncharacterized protein n=1 Tax=Trapa natans TaxID=22666 RepID=A0AAN7QRC4_TRANT|nr:hypothetical protein SAY86_014385 [Trapa natans]
MSGIVYAAIEGIFSTPVALITPAQRLSFYTYAVLRLSFNNTETYLILTVGETRELGAMDSAFKCLVTAQKKETYDRARVLGQFLPLALFSYEFLPFLQQQFSQSGDKIFQSKLVSMSDPCDDPLLLKLKLSSLGSSSPSFLIFESLLVSADTLIVLLLKEHMKMT